MRLAKVEVKVNLKKKKKKLLFIRILIEIQRNYTTMDRHETDNPSSGPVAVVRCSRLLIVPIKVKPVKNLKKQLKHINSSNHNQ